MKKAVILLSGGLDSATCLAIAKENKFECYALSFMYGQRHGAELNAAQAIVKKFNVAEHRIFHLDIAQFGGSALTDESITVPDYTESTTIPVTYVPARNTILLSVALSFAESMGSYDIFIGANSIDYSHYPDCRPEYIKAFQTLANLATKAGVAGQTFSIHAPLQYLTKAEIIRWGNQLGIDYSLTVSCYRANAEGEACGQCDSCTFRHQGFKSAGLPDPTRYW